MTEKGGWTSYFHEFRWVDAPAADPPNDGRRDRLRIALPPPSGFNYNLPPLPVGDQNEELLRQMDLSTQRTVLSRLADQIESTCELAGFSDLHRAVMATYFVNSFPTGEEDLDLKSPLAVLRDRGGSLDSKAVLLVKLLELLGFENVQAFQARKPGLSLFSARLITFGDAGGLPGDFPLVAGQFQFQTIVLGTEQPPEFLEIGDSEESKYARERPMPACF